jgi:ribonuclease E
MARRNSSLKPQLNQVRTWVAEGVTDIWIAHQLETTPAEVSAFRRQQGLLRPDEAAAAPAAAKPRRARASTAATPRTRAPKAAAAEVSSVESSADDAPDEAIADGDAPAKRRRRGRRGGRGRGRSKVETIAATLERDDQGVTIRIDAAVLELNIFREHWLELTSGVITVTADGITLAVAPPESDEEPADDVEQAVTEDESEPATS